MADRLAATAASIPTAISLFLEIGTIRRMISDIPCGLEVVTMRPICLLLAFSSAPVAQTAAPDSMPLQLVTPAEAALPEGNVPARPGIRSRGLFLAPDIELLEPSPSTLLRPLTSPFTLRLRFTPHNQATIPLANVDVRYLRGASIDVTDRLMQYLTGDGLNIRRLALPPGRNAFLFTVTDSNGHRQMTTVTVVVMK